MICPERHTSKKNGRTTYFVDKLGTDALAGGINQIDGE